MTKGVTTVTYQANTQTEPTVVILSHTSVFFGGSTGDGITEAQADARYVKLPTGGNDTDVMTRVAGVGQWRPPAISYASTNW